MSHSAGFSSPRLEFKGLSIFGTFDVRTDDLEKGSD